MHAAARIFLLTVIAASFGAEAVCFKSKDFAQVEGNSDRAAQLYVNVSERDDEMDQILLKGPASNVITSITCDDTKIPTRCRIMGDQARFLIQKDAAGLLRMTLRRFTLSLNADESGELHIGTIRTGRHSVQVHELEELTAAQCLELFKPVPLDYTGPDENGPAESKR